MTTVHHPFTPPSISIPHYVPSQHTMLEILVPFFTAVLLVLVVGTMLISNKMINLTTSSFWTKSLFLWFTMCGFIHTGVEGYFAYHYKTIAGQTTFMADLWKEYALSDSRYMTADPFVYLMENITAFGWGPLSFLTAYFIYTNNPTRHVFQFLISLGQLYGDVLYYTTTLAEDGGHCNPHPYYFYFYFVFMNAFWIVIPSLVLISSGKEMASALVIKQKMEQKKKSL
jgi:cholestenol Delta-isomerase